MLAELKTLMEGAHGTHTQICCICHIFNLAVKVMFYCTVMCYKYLYVVMFFLFKNPYYILQLFPHAKSSWIKRDYPLAP